MFRYRNFVGYDTVAFRARRIRKRWKLFPIKHLAATLWDVVICVNVVAYTGVDILNDFDIFTIAEHCANGCSESLEFVDDLHVVRYRSW